MKHLRESVLIVAAVACAVVVGAGVYFSIGQGRLDHLMGRLCSRLDLLNRKVVSDTATVPELYEQHILSGILRSVTTERREQERRITTPEQRDALYAKLEKQVTDALAIQYREVTTAELRRWLRENTYQEYARPSTSTHWQVHIPGQAHRDSRELVRRIREELARRAKAESE